MQLECFGNLLKIDFEKTKSYYQTAPRVSELCSCDACRNFERAVDTVSHQVLDFFAQFGIEIYKVREVYINCANAGKSMFYGGFYHVCGTLLSGMETWFSLTEDMEIRFRASCDLLDEDFPCPAFQLEFLADLPWLLPEGHQYPKDNSRRKK